MELTIPLIILALGAAFGLKKPEISLITSLVALGLSLVVETALLVSLMIALVAVLNIAGLLMMKKSYLRGVDYALVSLMLIATIVAIYSTSFAMLILAFIIVSTPTYMLVMASESGARVDVGIKYITFMVVATILFIIGAVLAVYGGSLGVENIQIIGISLMVLGIAMEVGAAPLHYWVPDVFDSADPIPASIIASLAKFVPFVIAFKILYTVNAERALLFIGVIAAISMLAGNIGALTSNKPARILAYSTVANMGYIIAALTVFYKPEFVYLAFAGVLLQLFANAFGKIGFFTAIREEGTNSVFSYLLALSFIGLPPLLGFWGKFYILAALIYANVMWLAILLVINSAMSVPYYIRLANLLSGKGNRGLAFCVIGISALIMLLTVLPPNWLIDSSQTLVSYFKIGGV